MDCSSLDGKNPLIMQWVVFALRNLCEANVDNQNVIGSLDKEGTVDVQLAEEFGLKIQPR